MTKPRDSRPGEATPEQGYLVDVERRSTFAHHFCGEHDLAGARCPNCEKPLLRMLTLDGRSFAGNAFVEVLFLLCARDAVVSSTQHASNLVPR